MLTGPTPPSRPPVRMLVLSWGPSIHAWRRIRIFESDPGFSVTVASTHDFGFERAENVRLSDARRSRSPSGRGTDIGDNLPGSIFPFIDTAKKTLARFPSVLFLRDLVKMIKDMTTLRKAFARCRPQVVLLQTVLYPCYLAFLLPKSIPIIITFWNGDVTWWAKSEGIEKVFRKKAVTYGVRRASALTVNSNVVRNACLGYGSPASKIHLIRYPGVEEHKFRPSAKGEAKEALNIDAEKVILCPRGVGGYLNSDVIVESAIDVVKAIPGVLFLFVSGAGSGEALRMHQDRVKQLGVEKNFRWDGQVLWESMPNYYNASDVMVSISSNDALPNCMTEALACGTPVLMGDIPQIREWIDDGRNGFLVPPRDSRKLSETLLAVLTLPSDEIAGITGRGRELVAREFDSSLHTSRIKDLVRRVAGNDAVGERRSSAGGEEEFRVS